MTTLRPPFSDDEAQLARALAGDAAALRASVAGGVARHHRLQPALARRAHLNGMTPDADQRNARAGASAHWMMLSHTLEAVGLTLDRAAVDWVPIKGCDVARRVYEVEEDRPSSDIDLLVRPHDFEAARSALLAAGWQGLSDHPVAERYRAEEGYAWQARRSDGPLVELHFRLWGLAPARYAAAVVDNAVPAAGIGSIRGPAFHDAYLLGATHHWLNPPPRALLGWWDLERIAQATKDDDDFAAHVVDRAHAWDLQLPVTLAATVAGALWPGSVHDAIATRLLPTLRRPERHVLRRLLRRGADEVGPPRVVLARLMAGRRSRGGWRVVRRRLWSHPGVVAQETPAAWSWSRRRLIHVLRRLGLGG